MIFVLATNVSIRPCITASEDVFCNGRGVNRVGDEWIYHHCSHHGGHNGHTIQGSSSVFVNGRPVGRVRDQIDCGSKIATGSGNVFAG